MRVTANEYCALLRNDLCAFTQRSFIELNPAAEFLSNWHIEVVTAEQEACRR